MRRRVRAGGQRGRRRAEDGPQGHLALRADRARPAAHAGLEPELGANAGVELAHQVLAIAGIAAQVESSSRAGATSVTPTMLTAGTSTNTVPARGRVAVDVRVPDLAAQRRVDELMRALAPHTPGVRLELRGGPNRPPLDPAASAGLFEVAVRLAAELGMARCAGCRSAAALTATSPRASAARRSTAWARWGAARTPPRSTSWSPRCRSAPAWSRRWSRTCCRAGRSAAPAAPIPHGPIPPMSIPHCGM
ncbi:hypothetical protein B1L11_25705 [Microbispora sp. GKU 823]|nr:hypothetical protein B1L11_25705 [Microbispora sp. GKU 823]